MSPASVWNCSFLATKSVSDASSIMAFSAAATRPFAAVRSAPRFAAFALPLTRSTSTALSKLPSASSRAFLLSIIPAPVASRSFFTSAAEIFAIECFVLRNQLIKGSGRGLVLRFSQLAGVFTGHVTVREFARRFDRGVGLLCPGGLQQITFPFGERLVGCHSAGLRLLVSSGVGGSGCPRHQPFGDCVRDH